MRNKMDRSHVTARVAMRSVVTVTVPVLDIVITFPTMLRADVTTPSLSTVFPLVSAS